MCVEARPPRGARHAGARTRSLTIVGTNRAREFPAVSRPTIRVPAMLVRMTGSSDASSVSSSRLLLLPVAKSEYELVSMPKHPRLCWFSKLMRIAMVSEAVGGCK